MRDQLTPEQMSRLAGIDLSVISELRDRGLIDPDGDGLLDEMDALRLRILMHYRSLGQSFDELEKAVRESSRFLLYADLLWADEGETLTAEDAAAQLDLPVDAVETMLRAVGLGSTVPADDVRFLEVIKGLVDGGIPLKMLLDLARVYGDTLRRLAQAEVRMIRDFVTEPGRSSLLKDREQSERLYTIQEVAAPVLEPMLLAIHRRHLLRASIQEAVADLEAAERGEDRETLEAAIVFVDLASFTALADVHGDEVAAQTLDRFDELVRGLLDEYEGTLIKQIGDAFMLVFTDPAQAVGFAIELDAAAFREPNFPALRSGIHSGPVLYRVGDYVGNTVNLAARIAAMAAAGEILITEPVAAVAADAGVRLVETGEHELPGVTDLIRLWRVERRAPRLERERDPVCGMALGPDVAGRLIYDGVEYGFCSRACLSRFLDDPDRYISTERATKPEL